MLGNITFDTIQNYSCDLIYRRFRASTLLSCHFAQIVTIFVEQTMDLFKRKHHFPSATSSLETSLLFDDVVELDDWKERLSKLASLNETAIRFPDTDKFIGDAFEHFVECIIRFYSDNPHVNCADLKPAPENEPGVDFIGVTLDGSIHTVQCKYRSDRNILLSNNSDGISMFPSISLTKYEAKVMSLWTTATGLHPTTEEAFNKKVRTFGFRQIEYLVNQRYDFWDFYAKDFGRSRRRKSKNKLGRLASGSFQLRYYQKQAYDSFVTAYNQSPWYKEGDVGSNIRSMKGRFIYPTGAGKTVIQSLILKEMISAEGTGIHVVVAPRIVLVNQLLSEYRELLGSTYLAMAFHSGKKELDYEKIDWVEQSTTVAQNVLKQHVRAKKLGQDLVVFSTYHSLCKLVETGIVFDTLIADESQYCIREDNFSDVREINSAVKLFFTATERHGIGERSNDNEEVFGSVIGQETVSNLINQKFLVRPVLHVVLGKRRDKELDSFVDEAAHVARFQRMEVHKKMSSRTLFACSNTKDVKAIVDHIKLVNEKLPDHDVFTIVSDRTYGSRVNGNKVSRDEFMNDLHFCQKNAMIFHYDILSEGIDIDGITGCAIMRRMGHAKLVQTIGRCLRVFKKDPSFKERALVSVPVIDGDEKNREHIREVVRMLMEGGFEVNIEEMVVSDNNRTGGEDQENKQENDQGKLDLRKRLQTTIKEVIHEIEDDYKKENLKILETKNTEDILKRLTRSIEGVTPDWNHRNLSHSDEYADFEDFRDDEIATILRIVTSRSAGHSIPTPKTLATRMIEEVRNSIEMQWAGKSIAVMYNMEFVDALRRENNLDLGDVTYFGDCYNKEIAMNAMGCDCRDVEELENWRGKKFDVVVGNPPYQSSSNTGNPIWPKFVEMALKISDGGGYYSPNTSAELAGVWFN